MIYECKVWTGKFWDIYRLNFSLGNSIKRVA